MKILLGDFNTKWGENIFKPTIGNESLHQDSNNNNGVRIVNFATSKNLFVKSTMFSPSLLMGRITTRLITY